MSRFTAADPGPEAQATFRDLVAHEVSMTSTLAVFQLFVPNRPAPKQRALDAMSPETWSEYLASHAKVAQGQGMPESIFKKAMAYERAFVRSGGLLGFGVGYNSAELIESVKGQIGIR